MRYVRFLHPSLAPQGGWGLVEEDGTVRVLDGSPFGEARPAGPTLAWDEIPRFLPPVDPPNLLAIGKNYAAHAREHDGDVPAAPVVFLKATTSVIAHREPILLPRDHAEEVDYEAELAIVIGRRARRLTRENALDCVLGFTCANDVSARDCQMRLDQQWARAKSFDTFCPLGPVLATGIDAADLRVRLRLNGTVLQDASTADMMSDVPALLVHLSACMTLLPGTVILTGTPAGVGHARRPPVFLRPGDRVEVEIDRVGTLENEVRAEA